jgi:uncharacterized membrane protein
VSDHAKTPHQAETDDIVIASPSISARRSTFVTLMRYIAVVFLLLAAAPAQPALADFRLCNNTGSRVGVALGYKDTQGWMTEGWWNVTPRNCETLLRGALVARYYYIYAVDYDRGGEWSGHAFMCSREKEFTIRGTDNCLARGYDRTGFFEVDTSEQRTWTVQLTDTAETGPDRPLLPLGPLRPPPRAPGPPPPVGAGKP